MTKTITEITAELLSAKVALFNHKQNWHADPESMSKREYLRTEAALRGKVATARAAYDAQAVA